MFSLFTPYSDRIDVRFYAKGDEPLSEENIVSLNQVHGNTTIIARSPSRREKEADGVLTDQPDLRLTIRIADCQSFVLYVPDHHVIGLLHAGWKGLKCGAIPEFFRTMRNQWDIDASSILIGAGPSLCVNCAQFTDPAKELSNIDPKFFHARHADLRAIADDQLIACGIIPSHIERNPDCTRCSHLRYWTYRGGDRDAVIKGSTNMLTCMLKKRK